MRVALVLLIAVLKLCDGQDIGPCGEIPMTVWAGEASLIKEEMPSPVGIVIIQHSVTEPCNSDDECVAILKQMRELHMKKGFDDVGNSFLVGGAGQVYEGSGWSLVGRHTKKYNNRSIGLSFVGDYRQILPTPEALQAAKDLIGCGVEHQFLAADYKLVGAMQVAQTESPGQTLENEIKSWPHWVETAKL